MGLTQAALTAIHPNGTCEITREITRSLSRQQHGQAVAPGVAALVDVDEVAILIGSEPDLSFLPQEVRDALAADGPPPQEFDGIRATHPVWVDVHPYTAEATVWPTLYALGPLRGDNFARFAIHDGHIVAASIAARLGMEVEPQTHASVCSAGSPVPSSAGDECAEKD